MAEAQADRCRSASRRQSRTDCRAYPQKVMYLYLNSRSSLAKRPCNLLLKWLEEVLKRRAFVGLNKDLGRHPGNKANVLQAGNLVRRQRNANRVIRLCWLSGILLLLPCDV